MRLEAMTIINTNTGSLYAQQALNTNARALASVTQQLSTGKRINNSVDDVAGIVPLRRGPPCFDFLIEDAV